jgi:hypothetical protein
MTRQENKIPVYIEDSVVLLTRRELLSLDGLELIQAYTGTTTLYSVVKSEVTREENPKMHPEWDTYRRLALSQKILADQLLRRFDEDQAVGIMAKVSLEIQLCKYDER